MSAARPMEVCPSRGLAGLSCVPLRGCGEHGERSRGAGVGLRPPRAESRHRRVIAPTLQRRIWSRCNQTSAGPQRGLKRGIDPQKSGEVRWGRLEVSWDDKSPLPDVQWRSGRGLVRVKRVRRLSVVRRRCRGSRQPSKQRGCPIRPLWGRLSGVRYWPCPSGSGRNDTGRCSRCRQRSR